MSWREATCSHRIVGRIRGDKDIILSLEHSMGGLISLVPFVPLFKKRFLLSAKNIGTLSKSGLRTNSVNTFLNENENS